MLTFAALTASVILGQPIAPEDTIALLDHAPEIRVDVIAAEPLVIDPVAIAWDEHGTCYVVENQGYPTAQPDTHLGRVIVLSDTDGDGRYDERTLFADGFDYPNGVMAWKGGVLVTDSPSLWYLKDNDGDGMADTREPILEGFAPGGSTQLRVSHPTLGPDGWIYMTNGLSGGDIRVTKGDGTVVTMGANDLRYNPRTMELETISGRAQFGLTFDDFGNRYICSNRNHIQHAVLEPNEVGRNPYTSHRATINDIPSHGAAAKLYPLSENKTTAYSHIGTFTAACGLVIYRGTALPAAYRGNGFVCDPTGNLVHRDVIEPTGITLTATRGEEESEFLRSTDEWFRPVYLTNGPDGALYLCDMYRGTIEHPRYLPADLAARTDFERGKDRGRIYRIAAKENPPKAIDTTAVRNSLDHGMLSSQGWEVDTGQRLLLDQANPQQIEILRERIFSTENESTRVRLLYLLNSFGALTKEDLLDYGIKENPYFAELRLRLLAPYAGTDEAVDESIAYELAQNEPHRALAISQIVASWPEPERVQAFAQIFRETPMDDYLRGALHSAAYGSGPELLLALTKTTYQDTEVLRTLAREAGQDHGPIAAAASFNHFLKRDLASNEAAITAILEGTLERLNQRNDLNATPLDSLITAFDNVENRTEEMAPGIPRFKTYLQNKKARWIALAQGEHDPTSAERTHAIRMLAYVDEAAVGETLKNLLNTRTIEDHQRAAIATLSKCSDATALAAILDPSSWQALTPRAREDAVNALLLRKSRIDALFDAIESEKVSARSLTALQRNRLLRSGNAEVKARAGKLFAALNAGRAEALAKFQPAAKQEGDLQRGATHYETLCASCHLFQGQGHSVGPELSDIRAKTAETILLHIIEPNREVTSGYETCEVETVDGDTYTGILANDSDAGITLTQAYGNQATIARADIAAVRTAPLSLMPEGVEEGLTVQDMADLIAFLRRDL